MNWLASEFSLAIFFIFSLVNSLASEFVGAVNKIWIGPDRIGLKNLDRIGFYQRSLDRIAKSRVALNSRQKLSRGYLDQDGGKRSK